MSSRTQATLAYSQFQYTVSEGFLTRQQRQFYEDNGFLVVRNLVPKEKLAVFRQRFEDICRGKVESSSMIMTRDIAIDKSEFVEGQRAITKLHDMHHDDVLFEYCKLPTVVSCVQDFVGPNVVAAYSMIVNKPPDPGILSSRHPLHQDLHYIPFRPANRIVAAWTAMQTVSRDNGCLAVIPGSHKGQLLEHQYPKVWNGLVNKMYHGIVGYNPDKDERVWLEMEEGDTVFFHPLLIHGSGANRTSGFRKAISAHYAAAECEYIDVTGTTQEILATEHVGILSKKSDKPVTYQDIYKEKARLICGERVNM